MGSRDLPVTLPRQRTAPLPIVILGPTTPQLISTSAGERWSELIGLMSWQLWFARSDCKDKPLPWQSAQQALSPGRVAQDFPSIIAAIGTPVQAPKTRGKSPGRAQGDSQGP